MNCRATRQRISAWLVIALRPQTMFHRPSASTVATAASANGTRITTSRRAKRSLASEQLGNRLRQPTKAVIEADDQKGDQTPQKSEGKNIADVMPGDAGSHLVRGKDDRRLDLFRCHGRE